MGPGMMGQGWRRGGPGMMGRSGQQGYGMGQRQMGPGYGPGSQYQQQPQKPMQKQDAETILNNYLASTRNPNLKLGKIEDKGNVFQADITTKDGSLVDRIMVDKSTGWIRSAY